MRKRRAPCDRVSRLALGMVSGFRPGFRLFGTREVQRALRGAARAERERGQLHRLWSDGALRLRGLGCVGIGTLWGSAASHLFDGRVARRRDGADGRGRRAARRGARRDRRLGLYFAARDLAVCDEKESPPAHARGDVYRRRTVQKETERLVRQLLHRRGAQEYRGAGAFDPRRGRPLRSAAHGV